MTQKGKQKKVKVRQPYFKLKKYVISYKWNKNEMQFIFKEHRFQYSKALMYK